jgi:hypothetical protein
MASRDVFLTERVPMVGVAAHILDTVIGELVKRDYHIVLADSDTVVEHGQKPENDILYDEEMFLPEETDENPFLQFDRNDYKEPFVVIEWSESESFVDGEVMTFTEAD